MGIKDKVKGEKGERVREDKKSIPHAKDYAAAF